MWHFDQHKRSDDYTPSPIPKERFKNGVFVFLGKLLPVRDLDCEMILDDFDDLLPLYQYVQSDGAREPFSTPTEAAFVFRPGCTVKPQATVASLVTHQLDVTLRHYVLQMALYQRLAA